MFVEQKKYFSNEKKRFDSIENDLKNTDSHIFFRMNASSDHSHSTWSNGMMWRKRENERTFAFHFERTSNQGTNH